MRETDGLINQGMQSTEGKEYDTLSKGTDYSGLLGQSDGMNQSLGYGDQGMSAAIKQKYSKPFQVQQQGMQNKMKLDAKNEHFEKIKVAHHLASEEVNLNFQKELIKYKQQKQRQAQRQALAAGILGIGGTALGTYFGGAAGGQAGGQAGNATATGIAANNK